MMIEGKLGRLYVYAAALLFGVPCELVAQEREPRSVEPLRVEDAMAAAELQLHSELAAISPDGKLVVYTVCDPSRAPAAASNLRDRATRNAAYHSGGCDLWLSPMVGGGAKKVTPEDGNDWSPAWSPDGQHLAYLSDRGGKPRLWIWELRSGKSRMVSDAGTRTRFASEGPIWTPSGKGLVVKLYPEGIAQEMLDGLAPVSTLIEEKVEGSTVTVMRAGTAVPEPEEATGDDSAARAADSMLGDLSLVDVATGRVRRLVRGRTQSFTLSPDGRHLAFITITAAGGARPKFDIRLVELATGETRTLVPGIEQDYLGVLRWSPDGRSIAYTSRAEPADAGEGAITNPTAMLEARDLYVVRLDDGIPRRLVGAPAGSFGPDRLAPLWDEQGKRVVATGSGRIWVGNVANDGLTAVPASEEIEFGFLLKQGKERVWSPDGGASVVAVGRNRRTRENGFYRVELASGRTAPLLEGAHNFGDPYAQPIVSMDGKRVVFSAESASEPVELWIADAGFGSPGRLTSINPGLERYTFGTSRSVEFRSADGKALHASLLLPAGYQEGRRYPLVVWVYASEANTANALTRFGLIGISAFNMHMLTTRGYAVLWPDIPVNVGSPMQDLMKAVMPAIDRVVELGIADPERLAVMGQSNGGYSTLSLIAQTNRFKAAVMNAGFGDLTAFYGAMDRDGRGGWHPWLEQLGGGMGAPPWEVPLRYVMNSPIYFLDRIQTPLIIQAGTEDLGIIPYSDQVFVGLKRLGKEVTYLRYGGEGHLLSSYPNLVDYWRRVTEFLNEHLGGRTESVFVP